MTRDEEYPIAVEWGPKVNYLNTSTYRYMKDALIDAQAYVKDDIDNYADIYIYYGGKWHYSCTVCSIRGKGYAEDTESREQFLSND